MKINKILRILIVGFLLTNTMFPVFASNPNFAIGSFEDKDVPTSMSSFVDNSFTEAIRIAKVIGIGISVIIIMVIACKYMLAAPGDRADIKKNAVPFVIGAIVLFGASNLLDILIDVGIAFGS